jgi:hypothetical protein
MITITLAKFDHPDNKYMLVGLKGTTKVCFKPNSCATNADNKRVWRVGEYFTESEVDRLEKEDQYLINITKA